MAKLTRRKRRELNMKSQHQEVGDTVRDERLVSKKSKKKHTCIFHKYQELPDGTFVCKYCGHHFEKEMDEKKLRKYFQDRNEFSLTELRNMDCHLLKVTFGRNTRGVVTEYETEVLTGNAAIRIVFDLWDNFRFVKEDLTYAQTMDLEVLPTSHLPEIEDGSILQEAIEDGMDMDLFHHFRQWCDKDDPCYQERKWIYRDEQKNIICYWVNSVYCDIYPMNWTFFCACISDPVMVRKCVLNSEWLIEKQCIYLNDYEIYSLSK